MHEYEENNDAGTGQSTRQLSDSNADDEGGNEMDNTDWSIYLPASQLSPPSMAAESSLTTLSRAHNNRGGQAVRRRRQSL